MRFLSATLGLLVLAASGSSSELTRMERKALEVALDEPAFVEVVGAAAGASESPDKVLSGLDRVLESIGEQQDAADKAREASVKQYGTLIAKYETLVKVSEEELNREEGKCDPDHPHPEMTARKVHMWTTMLGKDDAEVKLVEERLASHQQRYDEDAAGMVTSTQTVATQREQVEHVMQVVEEVTGIVATHYSKVQTASEKARLLDAVSLLQVGSGAKRAARRLRRVDAKLHRLLASVKDNAQVSAALEAAVATTKGDDVTMRAGQDIGAAVFDALQRLQQQLNAQLAHLDRAWDAVAKMNATVLAPQHEKLESLRTELSELKARRTHLKRSIADAQSEEQRRDSAYAACEELVAPVKERLEKRREALASVRESSTVTLDEQRRAQVQLAEQEKLAGVLRKMIAVKLAAVRHALSKAYTPGDMGGATGMQARAGAGVFAPTDYTHDEAAMEEALMAGKTGLGCTEGDCEKVMAQQQDRIKEQLDAEKEGAADLERQLGVEVERAEEVAKTDVYAAEFAGAEAEKEGKMTLNDLLTAPTGEAALTASEQLSKHLSEKTQLEIEQAASPTNAYVVELRAAEEKRAAEEEKRIARQRKLAADRAERERAAEAEWTQQQQYVEDAEKVAEQYGIPMPAMTGPAATGAAARTEQARLYRETVLARVERALKRIEAEAKTDPQGDAARSLVDDLERAALSHVSSEVSERLGGAAISREEAKEIIKNSMAAAARAGAGTHADDSAASDAARAAVEEVLQFDAHEYLSAAAAAREVEKSASGATLATGPASAASVAVDAGLDMHPAGEHNAPSDAAVDVSHSGSTDAVDVSDAATERMAGTAENAAVARAVAAGATGMGEEGMAEMAEAEAARGVASSMKADSDATVAQQAAGVNAERAAFEEATKDMTPTELKLAAKDEHARELAAVANAHDAFVQDMRQRMRNGVQAAMTQATGATGATGAVETVAEADAAAETADEELVAKSIELEAASAEAQENLDAKALGDAAAVANKLESGATEEGQSPAARLSHLRHTASGKRAVEVVNKMAAESAEQRRVESEHLAALNKAAAEAEEPEDEVAAEAEALVDAVMATGATGGGDFGSVAGGSF